MGCERATGPDQACRPGRRRCGRSARRGAGAVVRVRAGEVRPDLPANGPVGWVEEVLVRTELRGAGLGRALMRAFEDWAAAQGCALVALATRRAAPFYRALGYEESAAYFRKLLD
jgi:GNAT superfamily N-acetyltransferase